MNNFLRLFYAICTCGIGFRGPPGFGGQIGQPGQPGPPGNRGQDGFQGPLGPPGNTGSTGPQGSRGPPGTNGPPGSTGESGFVVRYKSLNVVFLSIALISLIFTRAFELTR